MKKGSVLAESLIVFFVILCCFFVALPFFVKNNQKEKDIVRWAQNYSNIEYAYAILKAQTEDSNTNLMSSITPHKLSQFLRIKRKLNSSYKPQFMNRYLKRELYDFDKFFESENGIVVAFKWVNPKCQKDICAVMLVDINGEQAPNVWGKDIFGINFRRENMEPVGKHLNISEMKKDCSKKGTGLACSAYYLIGGLVVK